MCAKSEYIFSNYPVTFLLVSQVLSCFETKKDALNITAYLAPGNCKERKMDDVQLSKGDIKASCEQHLGTLQEKNILFVYPVL